MKKYILASFICALLFAVGAYSLKPIQTQWFFKPRSVTSEHLNLQKSPSGSVAAATDSLLYTLRLLNADDASNTYHFSFIVQPTRGGLPAHLARRVSEIDPERYYFLNAKNDFAFVTENDTVYPNLYAMESTGDVFNGFRFSLVVELELRQRDGMHTFLFANKFLDHRPVSLAFSIPD